MDVHLKNPDLQAKIEQWAVDTGRGPDDLIEDAMAGYFEELMRVRAMLDGRYDDIKSGKVKLIDGDEALARLKEKAEARRNRRA